MDTKPSFLDIQSINISPDHNFPVSLSGNTFSINFGTVTPSDFYTVTVVTVVNHLGTPPGGNNHVSITTSSNGDPLFNDQASAHITIPSNTLPITLPMTGIAPGKASALPEQSIDYGELGSLWLEIPRLGVRIPIVGVPFGPDGWDVSWLGNDAGCLNGTAFPTWSGNSLITGHVYGANGLPGPFASLKSLSWDDQVIIHFQGRSYIYKVHTNEVISPTDTSIFSHKDYPWLTLLTCKDYNAQTITYIHRVAVGAVNVQIEADPTPGPGPGR